MPDSKAIPISPENNLLDSLHIAAPCSVSWDSMDGDDRTRHCGQCSKNVYNISAMSRSEANQFLQATAQQACIRFYKRGDGTILLDNCPVGLRKLRAQYRKVAAIFTTLISFAQGFVLAVLAGETSDKTAAGYACEMQMKQNKTSKNSGRATMGSLLINPSVGRNVGSHHVDDEVAVTNYRNRVMSIVSESLPKTENLGNASFYIFIIADGSVKKAEIFNYSPSEKTDQLILNSVRNLQLPALPQGVYNFPLCLYYECHPDKHVDVLRPLLSPRPIE